MPPASTVSVLTLEELRIYMQERVDEINRYLDSGRASSNHAIVLCVRRNLYHNLIETIERGYIHDAGATVVQPDD